MNCSWFICLQNAWKVPIPLCFMFVSVSMKCIVRRTNIYADHPAFFCRVSEFTEGALYWQESIGIRLTQQVKEHTALYDVNAQKHLRRASAKSEQHSIKSLAFVIDINKRMMLFGADTFLSIHTVHDFRVCHFISISKIGIGINPKNQAMLIRLSQASFFTNLKGLHPRGDREP